MKKLLFFLAAVFSSTAVIGQDVFKAKVVDSETGESLIGVNIVASTPSKDYVLVTDFKGNFDLDLSENPSIKLSISYVSYATVQTTVSTEMIVKEGRYVISMNPENTFLEPVNISALRASDLSPIAYANIDKEEIAKRNEGRDIPFILKELPSTVVSSDAGNGIGYTSMRIRGTGTSGINVTINGIPLNDPESHGVFWVNTPDLSTSASSIQVQRGVGSSTNGAGAFGASVNIKTNDIQTKPYAVSELFGGSFNSVKANLSFGTGLLNDHWAVDGRISSIQSDGFVDRASSDLRSYYLSASYYSEKTSVQLVHFGGNEVTYQAWYGIPDVKLNEDMAGIQEYIVNNGLSSADSANLVDSDPRKYNLYTYDNQVDNYSQDHTQLHFSHEFNKNWLLNTSLHYTGGRGYFEEYKGQESLSNYGIDDLIIGGDTITDSDIIRRRWLNNDFYGLTYNLRYTQSHLALNIGGALNQYDGDHFGEVIWAQYASNSQIREEYYQSFSQKSDVNTYVKAEWSYGSLQYFADIQFRRVDYSSAGQDNDLSAIAIREEFNFLNPKAGISYQLNKNDRAFASISVGGREPTRSDFIDANINQKPVQETLIDYELGYEKRTSKMRLAANAYFMDYQNQLAATGQLNDVGSPIRVNVDDSYRLGLELAAQYALSKKFQLSVNLSVSQNKILNHTEYTPSYDAAFNFIGYDTLSFDNTTIALSPSMVAGFSLMYSPIDGLELSTRTQFVDVQYLDNTQNKDRSLDAFSTTDLRVQYSLPKKIFGGNLSLNFLAANVFDAFYTPNGYTYGYFVDGYEVRDNLLYPMAGTNLMGGIRFEF